MREHVRDVGEGRVLWAETTEQGDRVCLLRRHCHDLYLFSPAVINLEHCSTVVSRSKVVEGGSRKRMAVR